MISSRIDFRRPAHTILVGLLVGSYITACAGCSRQYAGASDTSYAIAMSLVTISSRQMSDKLSEVDKLINERLAAGELSQHEAAYLREIVELGRSGDWQQAQQEAKCVLSDQVKR